MRGGVKEFEKGGVNRPPNAAKSRRVRLAVASIFFLTLSLFLSIKRCEHYMYYVCMCILYICIGGRLTGEHSCPKVMKSESAREKQRSRDSIRH